jgi:peptidoglycan/xylan/chitin deacetylase (PgdA/CDA1 family)
VKKLFKNFIWNSSKGKILLTFDDGPTIESTEIILKTLSDKKIKAAFFCVGNNVSNHPELVNQVLAERHLIGNHTYNHKRLTQISNYEAEEEIDSFNNLLKEKFNCKVFQTSLRKIYRFDAKDLTGKKYEVCYVVSPYL